MYSLKEREIAEIHDCQQEFKETDLKIRELKTILQRITPADDRHTIIQTETLTLLEIIKDDAVTFKIRCKN